MKTLRITVAALTLLTAATVAAESSKVAFLHVKDKILKEDCVEIKGKYDTVPSYTCYDEDDNPQSFTPGTDWISVKAEKVCFHHKVRDTIRTCMEITPLTGNASPCYTCSSGDGPSTSFVPTTKWEKLAADHKDCAPRLQSFDVPKTMVIPSLPDWGGNDAATQE